MKNLAILLNFLEKSDIRPLIRSLQVPVLAITGDKDPVVPPEEAHWLAENLSDAQLLIYNNTGHIPHWEAVDECSPAIVDWLGKHPVA